MKKPSAQNLRYHAKKSLRGHGQKKRHQRANPHIGSSFDSFLQEEGILDEVNATAVNRVLAWQNETE